jgi:uncharacterized protein YndB with AHSA1/START domain
MTSVGTPGAPETFDMALTRTFDAPVREVWRAWTEGDYVRTWWAYEQGPRLGRDPFVERIT